MGVLLRSSTVLRQRARRVKREFDEAVNIRVMAKLRDILKPRPRILFVGINPSLRSEQMGHHFASPGNPFWRLLYAAKLVPVELKSEDDKRLVEFDLALTSLCARATRSAAELTTAEMIVGQRLLAGKIRRLRPRVVAFVGVSIYRRFFGIAQGAGAGAKEQEIFGARVFVLPNPSGLNASYPGFKHKLIWFEKLQKFAEEN
ncbi:MAG TPA: mismatch-specific DNA-glycosylase [Candidatus Acidoferrales bacterium]|jgi:TDG/mug DNA glycosylase family protein|nr:mismatch-specific DNA-glycosylase [Candidatus Acidoferrales bacterium]